MFLHETKVNLFSLRRTKFATQHVQFFCVTLKCFENAKTFVTPFEKQCKFLTFGAFGDSN